MCQGRVLESGLLSAHGVSELAALEVGVRVLGGKLLPIGSSFASYLYYLFLNMCDRSSIFFVLDTHR